MLWGIPLASVLGLALFRTGASLKPERRTRFVWLVAGSAIALLPVLSAGASMRLLGPAALGASAGIGLVIERALFGRSRQETGAGPANVVVSLVALGLAVSHFAIVPEQAHAFTALAAQKEPEFDARMAWVRARMTPEKSTIVVLRSVSPPTAFVAPFMLRDAAPARFRVLCQAYGRIAVVRSGPRTLDVTQDGNEPLVHFGVGNPVRAVPFQVGEVVEVPGMRVIVGQLDADGLPKKLHFEFDRDLDDPSFFWIQAGVSGFSEAFLPPVGYGMLLAP